ncbi:hypothetical protein JOC34_001501 [Virgibacillus halotolerans]|nr:hypothetical protein [Virgibacillus halotolerans]MBM7599133.1 hypothetical protein [Virgibacillus halotolerans]
MLKVAPIRTFDKQDKESDPGKHRTQKIAFHFQGRASIGGAAMIFG